MRKISRDIHLMLSDDEYNMLVLREAAFRCGLHIRVWATATPSNVFVRCAHIMALGRFFCL